MGNSPKWLGEGEKKVFWTHGAKVCQGSLTPSETFFAPVQLKFAPVKKVFRSLGPKDLLHPLLTTFGNFQCSTRSPKRLGLQFQSVSAIFRTPSQSHEQERGWKERERERLLYTYPGNLIPQHFMSVSASVPPFYIT